MIYTDWTLIKTGLEFKQVNKNKKKHIQVLKTYPI